MKVELKATVCRSSDKKEDRQRKLDIPWSCWYRDSKLHKGISVVLRLRNNTRRVHWQLLSQCVLVSQCPTVGFWNRGGLTTFIYNFYTGDLR